MKRETTKITGKVELFGKQMPKQINKCEWAYAKTIPHRAGRITACSHSKIQNRCNLKYKGDCPYYTEWVQAAYLEVLEGFYTGGHINGINWKASMEAGKLITFKDGILRDDQGKEMEQFECVTEEELAEEEGKEMDYQSKGSYKRYLKECIQKLESKKRIIPLTVQEQEELEMLYFKLDTHQEQFQEQVIA